jgi:hypothetical protein
MTQIAPATLIAIQSHSAPAAPRPAAPVRLSTEALTLLGGGDPRQDAPPRVPATPRASAGAWRTDPPGSRLDITV